MPSCPSLLGQYPAISASTARFRPSPASTARASGSDVSRDGSAVAAAYTGPGVPLPRPYHNTNSYGRQGCEDGSQRHHDQENDGML
jgi:hypothetical protein